MSATIEALRALVAAAQGALTVADETAAEAARAYHRARLSMMEAEGAGESLDARWIRAWFAGDYRETARVSAMMHPDQHRADLKRITEIDAEMSRAAGETP